MRYHKLLLYTLLGLLLSATETSATDHPAGNHNEEPATWVKNINHKDFNQEAINNINQVLKDFNSSRKDRLFVLIGDYEVTRIEMQDVRTKDHLLFEEPQETPNPFNNIQFSKRSAITSPSPGPATPNAALMEIKKQLEDYPDLIIYSYSTVRWTDKDGHGHTRTFDGLYSTSEQLTKGDLLSRIIKKASVEGCRNMNIVSCISQTVYKLIEAISIEYDGPGSASNGIVNCGEEVTAMQNGSTKSILTPALMLPFANKAANLLDEHDKTQEINSSYLIVEDPVIFTNPLLRNRALPDPKFLTEELPEKLNKLALSDNSKFRIYVVCIKLPFVLPDTKRKEFARMVASISKVGGKQNTIVVVAPYYACEENSFSATSPMSTAGIDITPVVSDKQYQGHKAGASVTYEITPVMFMPCAFVADNARNEAMNAALLIEKSFRSGFVQLYTKVPKKWEVYAWNILVNGDAIYMGENQAPQVKHNVEGHEDVTGMVIQVDERFLDIIAAKEKCGLKSIPTAMILNPKDPSNTLIYTSRLKALYNDINRILSKPQKLKLISACENPSLGCLGLKQSRFTFDVTKDFVSAFIARKQDVEPKRKMQDDLFYGKVNPYKSSDLVLKFIDYLGMAAAIVDLDFAFDALGTYYAFRIGDKDADLYLASLAVPMVTGGTLRNAISAGSSFVLRTAKGGYAVVSRAAIHSMVGLKLALSDDVSELAFHMLKGDVFTQVARIEKEIPTLALVSDIERLAVKEAHDDIKYLNTVPDVVDDYKNALKEGPIPIKTPGNNPLEEFITSERTKTLLDPVKPIPLEEVSSMRRISLGNDDIKQSLKRLENVKPEPGWVDVVIHSSDGKFWVNGNLISHRDLAKYLEKNFSGLKDAKGIRLITCGGELSDETAEFLSRKIAKGMPVKKTDVDIGPSKDGRILGETEGKWKEFKNGKWTDAEPIAKATRADDVIFLGGKTVFKDVQWDIVAGRGIIVRVFSKEKPSVIVGSGFINPDKYLEVAIHSTPLADRKDVFQKIYTELLNKFGSNNIRGIKGSWKAGDPEIREVNNAISNASGKNVDIKGVAREAFRKETFIGQMAADKKFIEVEISGIRNDQGLYSGGEITVFFTRDPLAKDPLLTRILRAADELLHGPTPIPIDRLKAEQIGPVVRIIVDKASFPIKGPLISASMTDNNIILIRQVNDELLKYEDMIGYMYLMIGNTFKPMKADLDRIRGIQFNWSKESTPGAWAEFTDRLKMVTQRNKRKLEEATNEDIMDAAGRTSLGRPLQMYGLEGIPNTEAFLHVIVLSKTAETISLIFSKIPVVAPPTGIR